VRKGRYIGTLVRKGVRGTTGTTHIAGGALAGAIVGHLTGDPATGAVVGAIAGLFPDVDHPGSMVGRRFRPVAVLLETVFGHRSITHTIWFAVGISTLAGMLAGAVNGLLAPFGWVVFSPKLVTLAVGAGVFSHLVLDACTRSGIQPFTPLPLPGRFKKLEHIHGPLTTGSLLSEALAASVCWLLTLYFL